MSIASTLLHIDNVGPDETRFIATFSSGGIECAQVNVIVTADERIMELQDFYRYCNEPEYRGFARALFCATAMFAIDTLGDGSTEGWTLQLNASAKPDGPFEPDEADVVGSMGKMANIIGLDAHLLASAARGCVAKVIRAAIRGRHLQDFYGRVFGMRTESQSFRRDRLVSRMRGDLTTAIERCSHTLEFDNVTDMRSIRVSGYAYYADDDLDVRAAARRARRQERLAAARRTEDAQRNAEKRAKIERRQARAARRAASEARRQNVFHHHDEAWTDESESTTTAGD